MTSAKLLSYKWVIMIFTYLPISSGEYNYLYAQSYSTETLKVSELSNHIYVALEAFRKKDTTTFTLLTNKIVSQLKNRDLIFLQQDDLDSLHLLALDMFIMKMPIPSKEIFEKIIDYDFYNKLDNRSLIAKTHFYLAEIQSNFRNREEAIFHIKESINIYKYSGYKDTMDVINAYNKLAAYYKVMSQFTQALIALEESYSLHVIFFGRYSKQCAEIVNKIGNLYFYINNYPLAIRKYNESMFILQSLKIPDSSTMATNYFDIGTYYRFFKKYDKAIWFYSNAIELIKYNTSMKNDDLPYCHSQLGKTYMYVNKLDSAEYHFKKCIMWYDTNSNQNYKINHVYAHPCKNFANLYLAKGDLQKADSFITIAYNVFYNPKTSTSSGFEDILMLKGRIQLAQQKNKAAISTFDSCINILTRNNTIYPSDLYLRYSKQALAYRNLYFSSQLDTDLIKSLHYFELCKNIIFKELLNSAFNETKASMVEDAKSIFENYINIDILYQTKVYGAYVNHALAFELSELLHGLDIYSTIQESKTRISSQIPAAELKQDSLISSKITQLENKRYEISSNSDLLSNDSLLSKVNIELFDLKLELQKLRDKFTLNYPKSEHNAPFQIAKLGEVQSLLNDKQSLLEYFAGDSSLYLIAIKKDTSKIVKITLDFPSKEWIKELNASISTYHTSEHKTSTLYKTNLSNYVNLANSLYNKLIAPVSSFISSDIIIIPDRELAILPFDALLTEIPKNLSNFNTYNFMIKKYTISYCYSASILIELSKSKPIIQYQKNVLAFAPFSETNFNNSKTYSQNEFAVRYGLSHLPYSEKEVHNIQMIYPNNSNILKGKSATREAFLSNASKYKIIHLATHAQANYFEGDFSFLAFYMNPMIGDDAILRVNEINDMKLNSELIVLSACESGLGEQQLGIGVISLARSFLQSGCKSIISSLWKVNDKSTMEIMTHFHSKLYKGNQKHISLRNAKLNYIKENPGQLSHPFFWSGFIQIGDRSSLSF
jgi:CHAT domain-containing protein